MIGLGIGLFSNVAATSGGGGGGSAPVLSAPTGTKTASTTATVGVTTDTGSGTLYGVITTSSTPPTATQIKTGLDSAGASAMVSFSQAVSGTGAQSKNATGLTAANAPYCHFVHNSTGGDSNVVSTTALLGAEIVVNGTFATSSSWTMGANESISGGQAVFAGATAIFWQNNAGIVTGHTYQATYTISSLSAGQMKFYLGSAVQVGTQRSANGTYTENMTTTSGGELGLVPANAFAANVSNFSVKEVL